MTVLAPLCMEDYMMCQGNTRLLLLLEWCIKEQGTRTAATLTSLMCKSCFCVLQVILKAMATVSMVMVVVETVWPSCGRHCVCC